MDRIGKETLAELNESDTNVDEDVTRPLSDNEIEDAYANLSFRVIYQSSNYLLPQIRTLINDREVLNLRPEYQRRLRWTTRQKSLLIESLLLNIPIPPIFLFESDLARYEVMDGQQRLNAVHEYLENEFPLIGLEKLTFLNGKHYKKLPPRLRRGLDRASIGAIVLLQETRSDQDDPFLVRRFVFERLNTGGRPLNPQEMRNSIFRGPFNDLLVELARNSTFCRLFDIPVYTEVDQNEYYENPQRQKNTLYRSMGDCQIVLRFFSLLDDKFIKGSMRSILDNCMRRNQNLNQQEIEDLRDNFIKLIDACQKIFDGEAFLLPPAGQRTRRVSIALYDAVMIALYRKISNLNDLVSKKELVRSALERLIAEKQELLTGKANTAQAVKDRISSVESILNAFL